MGINETREQWLEKASIDLLSTSFLNYTIPAFRVSTGFTGSRAGMKAIGVCWNAKVTEDKKAQIYISPIIDDSLEVLGVLMHEIIHVLFPEAGHKGAFRRTAIEIGLIGPMRSTQAGEYLRECLNRLTQKIGVYPHAKLKLVETIETDKGSKRVPIKPIGAPKKQGTRMLKVSCRCGYTVRLSKKWYELGAPECPLCEITMEA